MNSETRTCQNCKGSFIIEPEDFQFYEKIKVPPPTWCISCRMQRRMAFRNERSLHKRTCQAPGHAEEMISMYAPDSPLVVYDRKFWNGDEWNALDYGRDVDNSRPFLAQFRDLVQDVPWFSLFNENAVESDYCNYTTDNHRCYLVFGGDFNENCRFSTYCFHSKDCADVHWTEKTELCYELIDSANCYGVSYGQFVRDSSDSSYLYDCVDVSHCVGCIGLRHKQYHILNIPYTKEEYENKIAELRLDNVVTRRQFEAKYQELIMSFPRRFASIAQSAASTGDKLLNAKNCHNCFELMGPSEDCRDLCLGGLNVRDVYGSNHVGHEAELVHDSMAIFSNARNIVSSLIISESYNITYSYNCRSSHDLFGCVNLRNKEYCILNKQYTKEEYEMMVPRLIARMSDMPYVDARGRRYAYGEFFPAEFSPFGYNETFAMEQFPLSKEKALAQGFSWRDSAEKRYVPTMRLGDIPDESASAPDSITQEVIECGHGGTCAHMCTTAFRIVPEELQYYRRLGLPLPRLCPNCRHYERLAKRNPNRLWHRACQCSGLRSDGGRFTNTGKHSHGSDKCSVEFETPYAPDRPEIVYCESCYNSEVA
ncbi:MAG: hypothetical protein RL681_43 [Candidatus Parcubacteria bacterium]|jgi:hypothetical protein